LLSDLMPNFPVLVGKNISSDFNVLYYRGLSNKCRPTTKIGYFVLYYRGLPEGSSKALNTPKTIKFIKISDKVTTLKR
jgi:hypothetical protein